ncbi:TolC family protein [Verrucomicrobiota bacterium sgz303538]
MIRWQRSLFLRFTGSVLTAIMAVLAPGCATYHPQPISAEQTHAAFEGRALGGAELREFFRAHGRKGLPSRWDLDSLALAAMCHHGDVRVAMAQAETAKAAIITAGARPNPTLSFDPQWNRTFAAGISPWTLGFTLDVPIETAGKRGHRIAQAREQSRAAALRVSQAAWQVRSRLRKAMLDLFAADRRVALLTQQQGTQENTATLMEARIAAGEIARPEIVQSRLLLNQTRLLLATAQKQAAEARADVAAAVGIPSHSLTGVPLDLSTFETIPAEVPRAKLRSGAFLQRADVLGGLSDYAAAEAALRLEIARQYPDVHLGPGYQFDQGDHKWTLGFSLTLPVFDQNQGPIAEAEAKRKEAATKFSALEAQVAGELDHALASYRGARQKIETAESLLTSQRKARESVETLLKAGEVDRLAALTAQVELDAIELGRLDALIEAQQALGALEDAAQTPLSR